jgi:hypothetical protein
MDPSGAIMNEKDNPRDERERPQKAVTHSAVLDYGDRYDRAHATIVNVSEERARIDVNPKLELPNTAYVIDPCRAKGLEPMRYSP